MKQWEDDDFYDSGEDEFHDRTGELEMKRKMRMQRVGKKSGRSKTVETYESLVSLTFTAVVTKDHFILTLRLFMNCVL